MEHQFFFSFVTSESAKSECAISCVFVADNTSKGNAFEQRLIITICTYTLRLYIFIEYT